MNKDVAAKKVLEILESVESDKNKEIESVQRANLGLESDLTVARKRHEEVNTELTRVIGLFDDYKIEFDNVATRLNAEVSKRDKEISRLEGVVQGLQGELTVRQTAIDYLREQSAASVRNAQTQSEDIRKAFEKDFKRLEEENDALKVKARGREPGDVETKELVREAAEAIRERTHQTWDRQKYLGLLGRLDSAAQG